MLCGQPKLATPPEFRRIATSNVYSSAPDSHAIVAFAHSGRNQRSNEGAAVFVIGFSESLRAAEHVRATIGARFSEVYIVRAGAWFLITREREDAPNFIKTHLGGDDGQFVRLTRAAMHRNFMQAQINVEIAYRGSRARAQARREDAREKYGVLATEACLDHGPLVAYTMPQNAMVDGGFAAAPAQVTYRALEPLWCVVIVCAPLYECPTVAFCAQFDALRDAREYIFNTLMPIAAENTVAHAIPMGQWLLCSQFASSRGSRESARTEAHEVDLALQRGPSNGPPPDASHEVVDHLSVEA